jgi:hypothetical protein
LIAVGAKVLCVFLAAAFSIWMTLAHRDMIAWRGTFEALNVVPLLFTLAIPVAFAVAILKYRLMNIDLIIRKTVVYAILSGAIVFMYLGLVGGLGSFLVYAFGMENQTTMIIGSTLIVAVLFVPLRNRLQLIVDRNLFRHRYGTRRRCGRLGRRAGRATARTSSSRRPPNVAAGTAESRGGDLRGAG